MRLNLNDNIRVKLTEHGKDIYYHQYDRTNKLLGREVCKPSYPKVDEDGYTTFQLWCFIELYGIHMGMTLPNVIEPLDIVFDAPTIEPERKWETCFVCPLSNGCPKMRGCTNEQAEGYASDIPDDCPLSIEPERKRGKWIDGYKRQTCSVCRQRGYRSWKFCPNCGSDNREEGDHS